MKDLYDAILPLERKHCSELKIFPHQTPSLIGDVLMDFALSSADRVKALKKKKAA